MKKSTHIQQILTFLSAIALLLVISGSAPEAVMAQDSEKVYSVVEQMPEIKGGLPALYKEIDYPREAVRKDISGRVFVQVIVHEDGTATDPKVLRDIGGGCGEAAAEAITKVKFKPGKQNGNKVKVKYSLPITFKIKK